MKLTVLHLMRPNYLLLLQNNPYCKLMVVARSRGRHFAWVLHISSCIVFLPIPNFLYFYLLSNLWVHTYYDKSRVIKNIYFCNEQDTKYNFGDGWGDLWISAGQERGVLDKLRVQDEQRKIEEVVLFIADPSWCNFTTTQDQPNPIKLP